MANQRRTSHGGHAGLEGFLTRAADGHADAATLRTFGLSGWAYVAVPDHPEHTLLRADFAQLSARHLAVRQAIADLVGAWRAEGIEALVFKGFHLAEFVYETPGMRAYHDVDLVVRPPDAEQAWRSAVELGWRVLWRLGEVDHPRAARAAGYDGHELAQLHHPGLGVTVDLHRRMAHNTHNQLPFHRAQERLTDLAWAASTAVAWHGTELRCIDPRDAVVVGLSVNRCWGSDAWRLKPRDFADAVALATRHGLTAEALHDRARELGVPRTFALFLARCDPFGNRIDLAPVGWADERRWNLAVARERGWADLERSLVRATELRREAVALARAWPTVGRFARGPADRAGVAEPASARATGTPTRPLGSTAWRDLRRAVHRSMRLLDVPEDRRGEVAVRSAHALLVRGGYVATLLPGDPAPVLVVDGDLLNVEGPVADEG